MILDAQANEFDSDLNLVADYLSIAEFLDWLRKGEIEIGKLTCARCISALATRFSRANDDS